MESTSTPAISTDAPHVTVVDQLRGPDLTVVRITPHAGLGTSPTKPIGPKPKLPEQQATRQPIARERGWDLVRTGRTGSAA